jgi:hypothetical protein
LATLTVIVPPVAGFEVAVDALPPPPLPHAATASAAAAATAVLARNVMGLR